MTEVTCPACKHVEHITLTETVYEAPFHCPECLGLYFIQIENDVLVSCEPLTESGYARWKLAQASRENNR